MDGRLDLCSNRSGCGDENICSIRVLPVARELSRQGVRHRIHRVLESALLLIDVLAATVRR